MIWRSLIPLVGIPVSLILVEYKYKTLQDLNQSAAKHGKVSQKILQDDTLKTCKTTDRKFEALGRQKLDQKSLNLSYRSMDLSYSERYLN